MFQYDPARMALSWNNIRIYGYAPDTMITVERDEDSFKKEVGAQGDTVRVATRNKGGKITFRLQAQSPVNDLLAAALIADEATGEGAGMAYLHDFNSNKPVAEAADSWLMKPATAEFSQDGGVREWVIDCADLLMYTGS